MGVHDYRCSLCGQPGSYACHEDTGGECEEEGFGDDGAHVTLFWFDRATAPRDAAAFDAARRSARRVTHHAYGYDWGAWEFVPSLNYRSIAMDGDESSGAWPVLSADEGCEGAPELPIGPDERVWAEVHCTLCEAVFAGSAAACRAHLARVSTQTGLPFDGDKVAFVAAVRELLARRQGR